MAKTFKFDKQDQQAGKYNVSSKKAKLTKQQAGRMEKAMLRTTGESAWSFISKQGHKLASLHKLIPTELNLAVKLDQ